MRRPSNVGLFFVSGPVEIVPGSLKIDFMPVRPPASPAIAASLAGSRGYVPSFRPGLANHCPACGHGGFHVGRITAECGNCSSPLPIAAARNTRKD